MNGAALDHTSPVPLHVQAEALLRRMAAQPPYAGGAFLPEEQSLARRLGVSRGTLRNALGRLVAEGLFERRRGVGTRVRPGPQHSGLGQWQSFAAEMAGRGIAVVDFQHRWHRVRGDAHCCRTLGLATGTRLWRLERLRGWDDQAVVLMESSFHPRIALQGDESTAAGLYHLLEDRFGLRPQRSEEHITAEAADARLAKRLGLRRGTPLLVRRRLVLERSGRPLEYAVNHYVSERCAYTLEMERPDGG